MYGVGMGMGVGVGVGAGVQPPAARWRALYARRPLRPIADQVQQAENVYESVAGAGAGAGATAGPCWWWRVSGAAPAAGRACRHARASQTLEFNERAARTHNNDYQGTMPRAGRAGRAGPEPEAEAAGAGGARGGGGGCAAPRLSASCGTIHVELPPCVLLVPRWRPPAPPPPRPAPRPSCSYHLLPESHRMLPFVCHQSTSRECCSDSESEIRDSEEGVPSDSESELASPARSRPASPAPPARSPDPGEDD